MKTLPATWYQTGCELYAGKEIRQPNSRHYGHNRNWNLLLSEEGCGKVLFSDAGYTIGKGDLVLLEPGRPREFLTVEPWTLHWIHFNLDAHLQSRPEWPSRGRGVYQLHPDPESKKEILRLFSEIRILCHIRRIGWYRLCYCLIQEILLRGNMLNEKGLTPEHIDFAAQVLQDVSSSVSMTELAERCSLSRSVFFRKFQETFGISPSLYREQQKLNFVRQQLESSGKSLKEIAELCGYDNAFYLSSRFKKNFGISPREYRKNYLNSLSREH